MVKVPPSRATACSPGRPGRTASGRGCSTHLSRQTPVVAQGAAVSTAIVADSTAFDDSGVGDREHRERAGSAVHAAAARRVGRRGRRRGRARCAAWRRRRRRPQRAQRKRRVHRKPDPARSAGTHRQRT